ncbi:MAG: EAL domain-containing protein [Sulfurimonas sp.]|uniref:bifunctional diguanylate cyclase/phosphodiesterase n=1 Tax=Sulfurimonas sp. TaxID=2022749 RepID=UPI0025EEFB09|nr:GGDEF domain-containing phosphodiesterase [Sulfurimonas sp.]MCK9491835.1 EAL domain-containing protein [Sulfurimonas sp.]
MKLSFTSLTVKTLGLLFLSSSVFILFILFIAKDSFSEGYIYLVKEEVTSIEKKLHDEISTNLQNRTFDKLEVIIKPYLKHKKILLIKIDSDLLDKPLVVYKKEKSIQKLQDDKHFSFTKDIFKDGTLNKLASVTLIYSNHSYETYMQNFYRYFIGGVFIFGLAIIFLGFLLYNSLKKLRVLAKSLEKFNPYDTEVSIVSIDTNDEIGTISKSAGIMVNKLKSYIQSTKELNETIKQKEAHLKEAQRLAKVGSWEYNVVEKELTLSDEIYRILGVRFGTVITWDDLLAYISKEDSQRILNILEEAIKNGSKFNIKYALTLQSKKEIFVQTKGKVRKKQGGQVRITAITMDITNDIKNKQTIERLAYYDALTGLANRTLLQDRMEKALQYAKRQETCLAVMFLDLDHFKLINDTLGHSVGDELLIHISKILKIHLRESDTLSRLGGDEFIILLPSVKSHEDANIIANKVQNTLQCKHDIGKHQLYITSSMGIALYPEHGESADELIRNADTAMYEAKSSGRNSFAIYSKSMGNFVDKQLNLEQDLTQAVKNKEQIEVYYQVKVNAKDGFISGAEALVRWIHPTNGIIMPDDFIHIAESTGLMVELGNIVIEESISKLQELNRLGLSGLKIAINLSARQFQDPRLISFVSTMIERYEVNPAQVEFEITETLSMININNTLRILKELKQTGVSIAIDDFGTGHSSLSYLKKFPINSLKIDKTFVLDIIDDADDKAIVHAIISMAHSLGFTTVAEGVETKEHVDLLKEMGCDELQGYYFSKPVAKDELTSFMHNFTPTK